MDRTKITIIGAGIVGLASSYLLSKNQKDIMVLEKQHSFGQDTSSRNSEVIHAGLYYPKNSLKSLMCLRGKELLYQLCQENNIGHRKTGKMLVASQKDEIQKIEDIYKNSTDCGINNLYFIDKAKIQKLEPNVKAETALFSPDSGIVDSHFVMKHFYDASKSRGVEFAFNIEAIGITKKSDHYEITVREPDGEEFSFETNVVINAAGLYSDKVASLVGIDIEKNSYKIHYSKGQYFRVSNPGKLGIKHLVYPPPSKFDLGIHATPDLAGGLRLGPDAKYVDVIDYQININDQEIFFNSASKFLPELKLEDLIPDTSGIRAKLQSPQDDFRDFVIANEAEKGFPNFIDLLGIESPGLTSCLSIAERVKELIKK
ncbi:MAG: NAD(P)/FAD-dependent oxidoreductase [Candidatus Omnitrophica bacterium]|nr:NAD(P)/FAD-dependent oxidoreductase [Candidatus Omnitrophota bacterium]MBU1996888.1 NAD(P)/FAD-dependent oxidoreductase [Candidatus Omnitrophota bacterium]MBU4333633.1 NAD(P)/FAD-dependent oxidoreductase [Candidatus Omnitrophota bacterium]